ncbi:hypothetical protein [Cesiribacter sp. SM1]|uniref:hypothetical protein n=1 Tax=Cesiribacter sp. SM1 TaxID=2861196 RepID=UPI001CD2FB7A|nr:hypothetical protein [Cesiribacter sp. SM1]
MGNLSFFSLYARHQIRVVTEVFAGVSSKFLVFANTYKARVWQTCVWYPGQAL